MSLPSVYDPEALADDCKLLRMRALTSDNEVIATPECEQYLMLALAALEQAERFATLAEYKRRRGE